MMPFYDCRQGELFDERYREIPGTNPKQYLTDYVEFTDRLLPPIQDPLQKIDPRTGLWGGAEHAARLGVMIRADIINDI
jgi:hypothetical protein